MKEIKDRLKKEGIDLDHNRFLILQGEVEQISLMKPKAQTEHEEGMLEYLEDIIGTERYKIPIEKLKLHTDKLSDLRNEKLDRVAAIEEQVNVLKEARDQANDYLIQLNNITFLKHKKVQLHLKENKTKLVEATNFYNDKKQNYDKLTEDQKQDKIDLAKSEKELSKIEKAFSKVSKLLDTASSDIKNLNKEEQELNFENKSNETGLAKAEKEINTLKKKLIKLEDEPAKLKNKIEKLEEEKIELKKEEEEAQENLDKKMEELSGKTDELQNEKNELEKVNLEEKKEINKMTSSLKKNQEKLKLITANYDKIKTSYDKAVKELQQVESNQNTGDKQETLEENIKNVNEEINELEEDIAMIKQTVSSKNFDAQLANLDNKLAEKKEAIAETTQMTGNKMTDFFKKMQNEGHLNGGTFYGRLGDLGSIDKKYDVAISTAAGALDNLVCDSSDTAKTCIKLLKQYNKGQASFIALDKMEQYSGRIRCNKKLPAPRLYDLINISDKIFECAFWFAIQDTLVAENIDIARSYTRKERHRIVTLSGEMIETSGAMSGGGGRSKFGKMVISDGNNSTANQFSQGLSQKEISRIQNEIENLEMTIEKLYNEQKSYQDELTEKSSLLRKKSQQKNKFILDLEKLKMDAHKFKQKLDHLKSIIPNLKKDMEAALPQESETKDLDDKITNIQVEINEKEQAARKTVKEIKKIQDEIQRVNDQIQGPAKAWLSECREKVESNQKELTKLKADINKSGRTKKQTEDKIAGLEIDIQKINERQMEIEDRLKVIETQSVELLEKEKEYAVWRGLILRKIDF